MLQERRVIVWDSGVGGGKIFEELTSISEGVCFFRDSVHFPYGKKNVKSLTSIFRNNIKHLNLQADDVLVLACHTISCVYSLLLNELGLPCKVFSVLEYLLGGPDGLILCTSFTANYLRPLNKTVLALPELASLIENGSFDIAKESLKELVISQDLVLYGCTHYPLIHDAFCKAFPGKVFYNPENALIKGVKAHL